MATFAAVTAGTTGRKTFKLWYVPQGEETAVPFNSTGHTVTMILRDGNGALVESLGTLTPGNQSTREGEHDHDPVAATYNVNNFTANRARQQYTVRFKAVDGTGKPKYFPEGDPDVIPVYLP